MEESFLSKVNRVYNKIRFQLFRCTAEVFLDIGEYLMKKAWRV